MGKKHKRARLDGALASGPEAPAQATPAPAPGAGRGGGRAARRLASRLGGARLCFGKPLQAAGHTIVPVAGVRAVAFGRRAEAISAAAAPTPARDAPATVSAFWPGGRGGGYLRARPWGFIDIGPDGTRYEPIGRGRLADGAWGVALALGGLLVVRTLRQRQAGPRRSLRRSIGR
jgi:hypothetical protein